MHYSISAIIFLLYNFSSILTVEEDYYWREYTGTIPGDAIIGGRDINSKNVYIGQVYIKNWGIFVTEIHPGSREVQVGLNAKLYKLSSHIKILCGSQQNFYWMPANATNLHLQLLDKHAVIGGHVDDYGNLNIARISVEGDTKIARTLAFSIGDAGMFYVHKGAEVRANTYEVLMYRQNDFDVRNSSD